MFLDKLKRTPSNFANKLNTLSKDHSVYPTKGKRLRLKSHTNSDDVIVPNMHEISDNYDKNAQMKDIAFEVLMDPADNDLPLLSNARQSNTFTRALSLADSDRLQNRNENQNKTNGSSNLESDLFKAIHFVINGLWIIIKHLWFMDLYFTIVISNDSNFKVHVPSTCVGIAFFIVSSMLTSGNRPQSNVRDEKSIFSSIFYLAVFAAIFYFGINIYKNIPKENSKGKIEQLDAFNTVNAMSIKKSKTSKTYKALQIPIISKIKTETDIDLSSKLSSKSASLLSNQSKKSDSDSDNSLSDDAFENFKKIDLMTFKNPNRTPVQPVSDHVHRYELRKQKKLDLNLPLPMPKYEESTTPPAHREKRYTLEEMSGAGRDELLRAFNR
ncbi:hypothetical protein DAMA08_049210 [Martiniozyma asiatica (nom. inval.)]|nr:hypothetical protein DAMA08_049210 [Martiniozyma asiatica]